MSFQRLLEILAVLVVLGVIVAISIPSCVVEGTLVETPSGPRAIEDLRVGDKVLSLTPAGTFAEGKVVAVQKGLAWRWLSLSYGGQRPLQVTAAHPVFGPRGFRPAGELQARDEVRTRQGHQALVSIETRYGPGRVYDLTVEPYENFVAAGVVVHNKRSRLSANESGAIGDLRTFVSGQSAYQSMNGTYGRPDCLARPASCGHPANTPTMIDPALASLAPKSGYKRSFVAGPVANGSPDPGLAGFVYVATPITPSQTGVRGFAVDHNGLLCYTKDGTPPRMVGGVALDPKCDVVQ